MFVTTETVVYTTWKYNIPPAIKLLRQPILFHFSNTPQNCLYTGNCSNSCCSCCDSSCFYFFLLCIFCTCCLYFSPGCFTPFLILSQKKKIQHCMKMFVAIHVGILRIEENDRKFKCDQKLRDRMSRLVTVNSEKLLKKLQGC